MLRARWLVGYLVQSTVGLNNFRQLDDLIRLDPPVVFTMGLVDSSLGQREQQTVPVVELQKLSVGPVHESQGKGRIDEKLIHS